MKLRTTLASQVESAMTSTMVVSAEAANGDAANFLARYPVRSMSPLYPRIVQLKKQRQVSGKQLAAEVAKRFAARASRSHAAFNPPDLSRTYVMELSDPSRLEGILAALRSDPNVEFAEPDNVVSLYQSPNDPYFGSYGSWGQPYYDLWGIRRIGSPTAWNITSGQGIVVAVVDTGVDYNHPDISANVWTNQKEIAGNGIDDDGNGFIDDVRGWNFVARTNDPLDDNGHGTHVSGTIAATGNNGIGVIGVAWQATVMPLKAFDAQGQAFDSTTTAAIVYAADNGADVISNSWGGAGSSQAVAEAVDYAYNLGAVVVAAAGNNADDARNYYPAALWNVITVSATDPWDNLATFSNFGPKVDVAAPGLDILSLRASGTAAGTIVGDNYVLLNGTSMAAPHVSGAAALILAQHPEYSNEDVRQVLRVSASDLGTSGLDSSFGYGQVNASGALAVTNVLEAKISSPANGAKIVGTMPITGVARGTGFAQYRLEYGVGHLPSAWTLIESGASPVSGTLGSLDCSTLVDGIYSVRLTVLDGANHAFVDQIELSVAYVAISSPAVPAISIVATELKPGSPVSIVGRATGGTFQSFQIDWAKGQNPSSGWSSNGVVLTGNGSAPIADGVLGIWDTSSVKQADYYTIRVSVQNAGFKSEARTLVYLEPDLLGAAWPVWLDESTLPYSGIVPIVDGSGHTRLSFLAPTYLGSVTPPRFRTFSPDGTSQASVPLDFGGYFQPAFADFGDGKKSLMADARVIRGVNADNTTFTLPVALNVEFQFSQTILDDIDGDSAFETLTVGRQEWNGLSYIYAWRPDGRLVNSNFPIQIQDQSSLSSATRGLVVGDIDGDGKKEIVVQTGTSTNTFTLLLFANDGSPRVWTAPTFQGSPDQMILVDFDHNGKLEIVLTSLSSDHYHRLLHVLQPDGSERTGWPVDIGNTNNYAYLAAGDLARDGNQQIIASNGDKLHVFNADGTKFSTSWPQVSSVFNLFGPALVADIDGDGYPEIITSRGDTSIPLGSTSSVLTIPPALNAETGAARARVEASGTSAFDFYWTPKLLAYRRDGSVARSWLLLGMNGNQPSYNPTLTVGDFNKDGLADIAVLNGMILGGGYNGWVGEGSLAVLTTGAPIDPDGDDWPSNFQNARNTGILRRLAKTTTVVASSANPSVFGQPVKLTASVAALNSSGSAPTGTVDLAEGGTPVGSCSLSSGSCELQIATLTAGQHQFSANYAGDNKFDQSSSPFVQTVSKAATSLSLTSSSAVSVLGEPVTFMAGLSAVAPGAGVPTGTVTFYDGTTVLGTATPDATGHASVTPTNLAQGSHDLSAAYGGSGNFLSSASDAVPHAVDAADFALSGSSAQTVDAGGSATYSITVSPNPSPYNFAVTGFACSGLPTAAACTFTPASVTPGTDPGTVTLSIRTTARNSAALRSHPSSQGPLFALWLGLGVAGIAGTFKLGKQRKIGAQVLLLLCLASCLVSCGGGGGGSTPPPPPTGTPAGTYTITITAIGNVSTSHTTTVSLTVK